MQKLKNKVFLSWDFYRGEMISLSSTENGIKLIFFSFKVCENEKVSFG